MQEPVVFGNETSIAKLIFQLENCLPILVIISVIKGLLAKDAMRDTREP
mgnify:CR=1 FL=1